MPIFSYMIARAVPLVFAFGLLLTGAAVADEAKVPMTGSQQDVTVPHALPGARMSGPEASQHIASPSGVVPKTGSAQGPNIPSQLNEVLPHPDVTAPPNLVPQTGSAQGVNPPNSR